MVIRSEIPHLLDLSILLISIPQKRSTEWLVVVLKPGVPG